MSQEKQETTSVGVVGKGFVGNAIYEYFKGRTVCKAYDVCPSKSPHTLLEVLASDIVFICLPTPMGKDGECDLSYITQFFNAVSIGENNPLFVIKSTVPIGTTKQICLHRPDIKVVNNPEFLTAANSVADFQNTDRHLIGGREEWCITLRDFYKAHFPNTTARVVSSDESEAAKHFANAFLATKVVFFNNLYETCQRFEMDYEAVRDGVCLDQRIGFSHTKVPSIDGNFGFGGYCFPKDINALIATQRQNDIDFSLLDAVWKYNQKMRGEQIAIDGPPSFSNDKTN